MNDTEKIRVLFVDDEPLLTDIAQRFLERSGYCRVDVKNSAADALKSLKSGHYDIVISDYMMPDMDGITFLKAVRSANPRIPFIVFTGKGREEVVIEALNNGADYYLQKGGDPASQFTQLLSVARKAVDQSKSGQELFEKNHILDAILAASPFGIALVRDKTIQWVNDAMASMLLYPKEALIHQPIEMLFECRDVYLQMETQIMEDLKLKQSSSLTTRLKQKSGPVIECDLNVVPLFPKNPELGTMITVTDITKKRVFSREIERLSAFPYLESNPVIELNPRGQVSYFNEAAIDDLIHIGPGKTLEVFIPHDLPRLLDALKEQDTSHIEREVKIGEILYHEFITISPRFGVIRISAVNVDDTKRMQSAMKEMEEALRGR